MNVGDMVGWKHRLESNIPSELGIIVEPVKLSYDPWPYWKVVFGDRGLLLCRESDLQEVVG